MLDALLVVAGIGKLQVLYVLQFFLGQLLYHMRHHLLRHVLNTITTRFGLLFVRVILGDFVGLGLGHPGAKAALRLARQDLGRMSLSKAWSAGLRMRV